MTGKVTKLSEARKRNGTGKAGDRPLWEKEIRKKVEELNQTFALILMGDKALVLREYEDEEGRPSIGFVQPSAFRLFWDKERMQEGDREVGLGELWLRHPERRDYTGVVFAPPDWREGRWCAPRLPNGWYNLWKGYTVEPAAFYPNPDDHIQHFRTFADHVRRNVARGDKALARYVMAWFAHMIQRPSERLGVGLVLQGKQGVGKTTPGDIVGSLMGEHYVLIDHPEHLVGKFNPHMVKCLLLQADEGFWAGDKTAEGRLKGLLTSKKHMVEKKNVDPVSIMNYIHLLVTSNNSWVVPAGLEERRWAVIHVGDGNMQDKPFFKQMYEEMDDGGRAHLLAYLLQFDLDSVKLSDLPRTEALFSQKVASMTEVQSWWFDRLREGRLIPQHGDWKTEVSVDAVYGSYVAYADKLGKMRKLTKEQFGMQLGELMPERGFRRNQKVWVDLYETDPATGDSVPAKNHDGSRSRRRVNGYHFPDLRTCRAHFCELVRYAVDWGDDDDDEGGGAPPSGGGEGAPPPGGGGDAFDGCSDF